MTKRTTITRQTHIPETLVGAKDEKRARRKLQYDIERLEKEKENEEQEEKHDKKK
jgi:hypothetical protein